MSAIARLRAVRDRRRQIEERVGRDPGSPMWAEHVARYRHASKVGAGIALDVACGSGLGFSSLKQGVDGLVAGDIDGAAIAEARRSTVDVEGLCRLDVTALPFRSASFDLITSFETVEHVRDDGALVDELRRVLRPTGMVFISTPNRLVTGSEADAPSNPFHVREYTPDELERLLRRSFGRVDLLGQVTSPSYGRNAFWAQPTSPRDHVTRMCLKVALRLPAGGRRWLDRTLPRTLFPGPEDFEFRADAVDEAHALLAVCRP